MAIIHELLINKRPLKPNTEYKRQVSVSSRVEKYVPQILKGRSWDHDRHVLGWYNAWLVSQFQQLPSRIFDIFPSTNSDEKRFHRDGFWQSFLTAFLKIEECMVSTDPITIDQIITQLYDEGILVLPANDTVTNCEHHFEYARYLVFCALAWQTMLYTPTFSISSETTHGSLMLAIDEDNGCCEYTHMSIQQDSHVCSTEPISEFLMGFGVLLPSKNMCLNDDPNVQRQFHEQTYISVGTFNAYLLSAVAGLRIKWVDALACHLELNSRTREISLFRFPSFCQSHLARYVHDGDRAPIHACATMSNLRCQWATEDEINQLLGEVLLSYRLLFGQTRKSRNAFQSINPYPKGTASRDKIRDPLLPTLCTTKTWLGIYPGPSDKETYSLPRDFPILRYRLAVLQGHLSNTTSRTWAQLWRDKRDSANWLTFWAVILFGAFGSLMALLQVILQLIQLIKQ